MAKTTTSIPVRADDSFRRALRAEAGLRGVDIADLVRDALDAYCGDALREHAARFVATSAINLSHLRRTCDHDASTDERTPVLP